jgi:glutathione peroxidase
VTATAFDFTVRDLAGVPVDLGRYRASVLLIVNTASKCGYTPQYRGLEALYRQYRERGLVVLGFPCNQFGTQEPGAAQQIGAFCDDNFGITFPLFDKVAVNGSAAEPLFALLKKKAPGLLGSEAIKWNFTKFLVGRDGTVRARYAPATAPEKLTQDIERLLDE